MNILLVQADMSWQSPAVNCERFEMLVAGAGKADLIVLPEMFATGFITEPTETLDREGESLLEWMRNLARECDAAVVGSAAVEDCGLLYNRCYFVRPDGSFEFYDKRHLFSPGGEDKGYTAGRERVIVEWSGFRILLQVCYDLRFPVFSRNRGDYDMALYVGNWPRESKESLGCIAAGACDRECMLCRGGKSSGKRSGEQLRWRYLSCRFSWRCGRHGCRQ